MFNSRHSILIILVTQNLMFYIRGESNFKLDGTENIHASFLHKNHLNYMSAKLADTHLHLKFKNVRTV